MTFRIRPAILSVVLLFSKAAFSISCPLLSDIQAEGVAQSQERTPECYVGYKVSQYNTGFDWIFIIGYFNKITPPQPIVNLNVVLSHMVAPGVLDLSGNRIMCHYDTGQNYFSALAIRDIFQISSLKFKQYLGLGK